MKSVMDIYSNTSVDSDSLASYIEYDSNLGSYKVYICVAIL